MIEYETFRDINKLEFEILEEVKLDDERMEEETNNFQYFFGHYCDILKVVKKVGKKLLAISDGGVIYLIEHPFEIGDFLVKKREGLVKVEKDCFEKEWVRKMEKITEDYGITLDIEEFEIITKKSVEEFLVETKKKRDEQEEREKERSKEIEEKREEIEKEERENFKNGVISKNGFNISGKEIIFEYNKKLLLNRQVNKLLTFEDIEERYLGKEQLLIRKEIEYTKLIEDDDEWKELYKVEFNPSKINGVKIPKSKFDFIMNKIELDNKSEEQIILWRDLSGIKIELVKLKEITFEDNYPINIKMVDKNNFIITFMNKSRKFSWVDAKELFFSGRSCNTHYYNTSAFLNLTKEFGLEKKEIFEYIKKLRMLEKLKLLKN